MAQTIVKDKKLYEKRNHDDIFVRDVIGGLLMTLNNKLVYEQVWEDSSVGLENITIPFYYDIGNVTSERFLQDNYVTFGSQCGFKRISGNFDMLPRGVVSLESLQIEADSISNRMVMGEYQKEDPEDGKVKTYVAFLYVLPLTMTFTCEIRSSTFTEMLKINQACNEFFYKNKTFYINHKGMKLGCRVGFPDSFLGEKNTGFTMGGSETTDKNNLKQSFELQVECYQPVFDKSTERLKSNYIKAFASSIETTTQLGIAEKQGKLTVRNKVNDFTNNAAPYYYDVVMDVPSEEYNEYVSSGKLPTYNADENTYQNGLYTDKEETDLSEMYTNRNRISYGTNYLTKNGKASTDNLNMIYVIDDYDNWNMFPSGSTLRLRWQYRKHNADITNVVIKFKEKSSGYKDEPFLKGQTDDTTLAILSNELEYDWEIPSDFTGFNGTDLIYFNDDAIKVYKEPVIKVIPNPETMEITEDSFYVLDPGYFVSNLQNDLWDKKEKNSNGSFSYFTHIAAELDYQNSNGSYSQFTFQFPIKNNKIEVQEKYENRVNFSRLNQSIKLKYTGNIPYRVGSVSIQDAGNENIYTEIPNIVIV